jgi:hypothetical protein
MKTKVIGIRFDEKLLPLARAAAKSQYLSLTAFVNRLVAGVVYNDINFLKVFF